MRYKKLNIELIVLDDECDEIAAELNATLDRLEETFTLICGGLEAVTFERALTTKRSALTHTIAAAQTGVNRAHDAITRVLHAVI